MIYIITYTFVQVGAMDYEHRRYYFTQSEKGEFIKKYLSLKDKWYATDIRVFKAQAEEINIDDILNQL